MSLIIELLSRGRRENRRRRSRETRDFRAESLETRELLSTVVGEYIVYKLAGGDIYRISAQPNAQPEDLSVELNALSTGTEDANVNISANGQWLAINTDRFGIAAGNSGPGLAVVSADLKQGAAVVSGGQFVYPEGITAIASSGNLLVYSVGGGPHVRDLWEITRASTSSPWSVPVLLTANSPYQFNIEPALSADGTEVLFDGGQQPDKTGSEAICEEKTDGTGFHTVVTKADSPSSTNFNGRICTPSFAADGAVLFEAGSSDSHDGIWELPIGATTAVPVSGADDEVAPIGLPDGRTVSLWLGRAGNTAGAHELTLRDVSGNYLFTLQPNVDIADIGYGAGGTGTTNQVSTTTTLTATANPTLYGQARTFTATVSVVSPGTGTPTGRVTFLNGTASLGTGTLSTTNGVTTATLTSTALAVGTHSITASYSGDPNDAGSSSAALSATVTKASTKTALTASPGAPVVGQGLTFTAVVSPVSPGGGKPAKTVTFKDGATILGTVPLSVVNGVDRATFTTSALKVGTHSITAVYSGGPNYLGNTSSPLRLTVGKDNTTTKIKASANPAAVHQAVTLTATLVRYHTGRRPAHGPGDVQGGHQDARYRKGDHLEGNHDRHVHHVVARHRQASDHGLLRRRCERQGKQFRYADSDRAQVRRTPSVVGPSTVLVLHLARTLVS